MQLPKKKKVLDHLPPIVSQHQFLECDQKTPKKQKTKKTPRENEESLVEDEKKNRYFILP